MSDQKKILYDDSNGLDYVLVGDYYLPMIDLPEETRPIGYWVLFGKLNAAFSVRLKRVFRST